MSPFARFELGTTLISDLLVPESMSMPNSFCSKWIIAALAAALTLSPRSPASLVHVHIHLSPLQLNDVLVLNCDIVLRLHLNLSLLCLW